MTAKIIEGRALASRIKDEIRLRVETLREKGIIPGLAVVLVGDDPPSLIYVNNKERACRETGFKSEVIRLAASCPETKLLSLLEKLNKRSDLHGILVQLPLPPHIDEEKVIAAIDPHKDVDGFHPINMGRLFVGRPKLIPCTPLGCLKMIEETGLELKGKQAVIVGRSNNVGKPMAHLLLAQHATVTICHSRTVHLGDVTKKADILVAAVGRAGLITGEMVKPGAVVIDVGINRLPSGKLAGDVDFASVVPVAGWITPVPGGVGPMTIAMLLSNTLETLNYEQ